MCPCRGAGRASKKSKVASRSRNRLREASVNSVGCPRSGTSPGHTLGHPVHPLATAERQPGFP